MTTLIDRRCKRDQFGRSLCPPRPKFVHSHQPSVQTHRSQRLAPPGGQPGGGGSFPSGGGGGGGAVGEAVARRRGLLIPFVPPRRFSLPSRKVAEPAPTETLTEEEIMHAKLLQAARLREGVDGEDAQSPQEYLDGEGLGDWKLHEGSSMTEAEGKKGAVFHNAETNETRLVFTGTDPSSPQDLIADFKIGARSLPETARDIVDNIADGLGGFVPESGFEMVDMTARRAIREGVRAGLDPLQKAANVAGKALGSTVPKASESQAFTDAHEMGVRALETFPDSNIETVGHSLGAAKANHVAAEFEGGAIPAHLMNPALGSDLIANHAAGVAPSKTNILQVQGDILSDSKATNRQVKRLLDSAESAGRGENYNVKKISALKVNESSTGLTEHNADNFFKEGARVGDKESSLSEAYASKSKLHDLRMMHDAIKAQENKISFEDFYRIHKIESSRERARKLWEAAAEGEDTRFGSMLDRKFPDAESEALPYEDAPLLGLGNYELQDRGRMNLDDFQAWQKQGLTGHEQRYRMMNEKRGYNRSIGSMERNLLDKDAIVKDAYAKLRKFKTDFIEEEERTSGVIEGKTQELKLNPRTGWPDPSSFVEDAGLHPSEATQIRELTAGDKGFVRQQVRKLDERVGRTKTPTREETRAALAKARDEQVLAKFEAQRIARESEPIETKTSDSAPSPSTGYDKVLEHKGSGSPPSAEEVKQHLTPSTEELEQTHLNDGETTIEEHLANPEPTLTPEEQASFAAKSESSRKLAIDQHAASHNEDLSKFGTDHLDKIGLKPKKSLFEEKTGMTGREATGQLGLGLVLGAATSKITDAIYKDPTAEEYAKMSSEEKRSDRIQKEEVGGLVGGGLARGVGKALGSAAETGLGVELGAAALGGVVGGETGEFTTQKLESLGVNKTIAEASGATTGGASGGAAFVAGTRALPALGRGAAWTAKKALAATTESEAPTGGLLEAMMGGVEVGEETVGLEGAAETGGISLVGAAVGGAILGAAAYGGGKAYDALADTAVGKGVGKAASAAGSAVADVAKAGYDDLADSTAGKVVGAGTRAIGGVASDIADSSVGKAIGGAASSTVKAAGTATSAVVGGIEDAGSAIGHAASAAWDWL